MSFTNRHKLSISRKDLDSLIRGADNCVMLRSSADFDPKGPMDFFELVGVGVMEEFVLRSKEDIPLFSAWLSQRTDLILGYFSYDLKNCLEDLSSSNSDSIGFHLAYFFVPETVVKVLRNGELECFSHREHINIPQVKNISTKATVFETTLPIKHDYVAKVRSLMGHIQHGDIYEVNYCVQNKIENATIDPLTVFNQLQVVSPAPFSCFVADKGKYLLSSSPERFMTKSGRRLVSQPMKGTNRRNGDNELQKQRLSNDAKEVAENVMITDLVRNDLSKSAKPKSVNVDELCGVYAFEHVNQMISTVSCELRDDVHPLDAILNAFPMGSMTGAPKIRAMELIEEHEDFSRGLFSGAVGYFTPELDFDFNVVIRSILYNEAKGVVTFPTGGAITINSDPESEYEECLLKSEAMRKVLLNHD